MSGVNLFKVTTYTGTGSSLNVVLGFQPTYCEVFNDNGELVAIYAEGKTLIVSEEYDKPLSRVNAAPAASAKAKVAHGAFAVRIAGVVKTIAANTSGLTLTGDAIPQNKFGGFGYEVAADGTMDLKAAADNSTGYDTAAAALAAAKAVSVASNHVRVLYFTVKNTAGSFTPGTTELDATGVTTTFYEVVDDYALTSTGIVPQGNSPSDSQSITFHGVVIGTSQYVNKANQVYILKAYA